MNTLLYHCNEIVQNLSSFHCVDWRKSSPRIKLRKSLQVLALSQTSQCVYGQGHKFLGLPFPSCEGNIIMAFPFSCFLPACLVTGWTSGETLVFTVPCETRDLSYISEIYCICILYITKESLSTCDKVNCRSAKANSLKIQDNRLQKHLLCHLPGSSNT